MANSPSNPWIERVTSALAELPEEDLSLVVEFVEYLKRQRHPASISRERLETIRTAARSRARQLNAVPRVEVVRRFAQLAEEIRQEVVARGTAVEGDWEGD